MNTDLVHKALIAKKQKLEEVAQQLKEFEPENVDLMIEGLFLLPKKM